MAYTNCAKIWPNEGIMSLNFIEIECTIRLCEIFILKLMGKSYLTEAKLMNGLNII
jgi:hypothetical protein